MIGLKRELFILKTFKNMNKEELIQFLKDNLKLELFEENNPDYRYFNVRLYFGNEIICCTDTLFL